MKLVRRNTIKIESIQKMKSIPEIYLKILKTTRLQTKKMTGASYGRFRLLL